METNQEESDQLPEEGPGSQVPDDDGDSSARDSAAGNPGTPGSEGQSTGNPAAAGSEESNEDSEDD